MESIACRVCFIWRKKIVVKLCYGITNKTNKQTQFLECRDQHSSRYKYSNTLATLTLIILFVANVEIFKKVFLFFWQRTNIVFTIFFFQPKSSNLINYSTNMCWNCPMYFNISFVYVLNERGRKDLAAIWLFDFDLLKLSCFKQIKWGFLWKIQIRVAVSWIITTLPPWRDWKKKF